MKAPSRSHVPKVPLALSFGFAALALVLVAGARLSGYAPEQAASSGAVLQSRLLRFEEASDGRLAVVDGSTGRQIAMTSAGAEGFLKGALRGLTRIRKDDEAGRAAPYRLERLGNGQLLLIDTASGLTLDLNAYGRSNAATFAEFLETTGDKS